MVTHIKAFTYALKIPRVLSGEITQTIRPSGKRPVHEGDLILFHGWSGVPYKSAWSWRMRVRVEYVINVMVGRTGMKLFPMEAHQIITPWHNSHMDELARRDGIEPPTGDALGMYLNAQYPLFDEAPLPFQIIRFMRIEDDATSDL